MTSPTSSSDRPPGRVGAWQFQRELGRGGMGRIFEVVHVATGQRAALKLIEAPESPEQLERFGLEARIMAGLRHPALLRVLDILEADGVPAIVLELMAGSLQDRVRREGAMPWREGLELMARVADGLEHAHSRGILHRDIKLDNILLAEDGSPRLADFGLARLAENEQSLTDTGVLLGTPHTMSPEQIETPRLIDVRSDIYSLGATLYELLSGRRPVAGRAVLEIFQRAVQGELTPLHEVAPELPAEVHELVMSCLAMRREHRPESAARFAASCRAIAAGDEPPLYESSAATPAVARERDRLWVLATALLALLLVVVVAVFGLRERRFDARFARLAERAGIGRDELRTARAELDNSKDELDRQARRHEAELGEMRATAKRMAAEMAALRKSRDRATGSDKTLGKTSEEVEDEVRRGRLDQEALELAELGKLELGRDATVEARRHLFSGFARNGAGAGKARRALAELGASLQRLDPTRLVVPEQLPGPVEVLTFALDGRALLAANTRRMILWDSASGHVLLDREPGLDGPLAAGRVGRRPLHVMLQGQGSLHRIPVAGPGTVSDLNSLLATLSQTGEELLLWSRTRQKLGFMSTLDGRQLFDVDLAGTLKRALPTDEGWLLEVERDGVGALVAFHREAPHLRPRPLPEGFESGRLLAVSPDLGAMLFERDGVVSLHTSTIRTLGRAPAGAPTPSFSADGRRLVVSLEGGVEILEQTTGDEPRLIRRLTNLPALTQLAFEASGAGLACGASDGAIVVFAGDTLEPRGRLSGLPVRPGDGRKWATWLDSERLVAENGRGDFVVMDVRGRILRRDRSPGAEKAGRTLRLRPVEGGSWARLTERGVIELDGVPLDRTPSGRRGALVDVLVGAAGQSFVELTDDGAMFLRRSLTGPDVSPAVPANPKNPAVFVSFLDDRLVVGRRDGTLSRYDADRQSVVLFKPAGERRGRYRFIDCAGAVLVVDRDRPGLTFVSRSGRRFKVLHRSEVVAAAIASGTNPPSLVTMDAAGELVTRNLKTGKLMVRRRPGGAVRSLQISPDSRHMLLVGREVRVLDLIALHKNQVRHLGLTPRRLSLWKGRPAVLGKDAFCLVVPGRGRLTVPLVRTGAVVTATDQKDGWFQVAPTDEGRLQVERRGAGSGVRVIASEPLAATGAPSAIAATAQGRVLVAVGSDLYPLKLDQGQLVSAAPIAGKAPITALAAARTGDQLFAGDARGGIWLLEGDAGLRRIGQASVAIRAIARHSPEHAVFVGTSEGDVLVPGKDGPRSVLSLARPITALVRLEELGMIAVAAGDELCVHRTNPQHFLLSIRLDHPIVDLARSDDGRVLAVIDAAGTLRFMRLSEQTPEPVAVPAASLRPVRR